MYIDSFHFPSTLPNPPNLNSNPPPPPPPEKIPEGGEGGERKGEGGRRRGGKGGVEKLACLFLSELKWGGGD